MRQCPRCKAEIQPCDKFCMKCAEDLRPLHKECRHCGHSLIPEGEYNFCPVCGGVSPHHR